MKEFRFTFPVISGRSTLIGWIEDICPHCKKKNVHMFKDMDSDNLIIMCPDCKLQVRHSDTEVVRKVWKCNG